MDLSNPLIINTEVFLQCFGHCAGCFLTEAERAEENNYIRVIREPLLRLLHEAKDYSHVIIGFGRANLLNLPKKPLEELLLLMGECEELIPNKNVTYEVSSSLIGKVDYQIQNALFLLSQNRKIYFNVVINSEITSTNFWNNWEKLYAATFNERKSWGLSDNWGDILVLNINPKALPSLDFIEQHVADKGSPLNIALFPFNSTTITNEDLQSLNDWSKQLWDRFKHKDLNIKNYLKQLNNINLENNVADIIDYHNKNESSYYFIDKTGRVVPGSLSIMGEVDYVRLLEKFDTDTDVKKALTLMQKKKPCNNCSYQKECILSGAYLNMINNSKKIDKAQYCLNGYQSLFEAASKESQTSS